MSKVNWLVFAGVLFAGVAMAVAQTSAPQKPSAATTKAGASSKTGAAIRAPYDRALLNPALLKEKAPETYDAKFTTTKGDFTIHVTRAWAPLGADRFYNLVKHHFYDGASFFRVLDGFVVQFGINAYPKVSAAWRTATITDDPVKQSNKDGYVTYAKENRPDTRTTQVFISLGNNARLDAMGFAPFGQVTGDDMLTVVKLYSGYGEGAPSGNGPDQGEIEKQGKAYLDKGWPKLDSIKTAVIVAPAPVSAPAKK